MRESTWRVVCGATALAVIAGCGGPTVGTAEDGGDGSHADADAGTDAPAIDASCPGPSIDPPSPTCELMDPYEGGCLLPWPSSRFQSDAGGPHVITLPREGMPSNGTGAVDPEPWNGRDGYSPMTSMVVRIDPANALGTLPSWRAPETGTTGATILLDTTTDPHGVPVAHFAETQGSTVDLRFAGHARVDDPVEPCWTTLYIRPAARLRPNSHYVVAVRSVGAPPISPPGFEALRTSPTSPPALAARAADLEANVLSVLDPLVPRDELIIAWDFWTGSDDEASADLVAMRDASSAMIDHLGCQVSSSTMDASGNVHVTGDIDVPYFLNDTTVTDGTPIDSLETGGRSRLRRPIASSISVRAPFEAYVPRSALDRTGAIRVVEYGHGLLNWPNEVAGDEITPVLAASAVIGISTAAHGLASPPSTVSQDQLRIVNAFSNLSAFSSVTDHILQGVIAQLVLPHVFVGACVSHIPQLDGHTVDSTRFAWLGNSQGGIMGPTIAALDPSFDRLALGVGGASYSIMLPRSCDWPEQWLADLLRSRYPHARFQRDLLMVMFQTHFDRFEGATFAPHLGETSGPFARMAAPHILFQTAVGDLGSPEPAGEIDARTLGLGHLAESATTAGLGLVADGSDSAFVSYSFDGAPTPPDGPEWDIDQCEASLVICEHTPNVPNNVHEWVRRDPASRTQIEQFLMTGEVVPTCGGSCANRPACPPN